MNGLLLMGIVYFVGLVAIQNYYERTPFFSDIKRSLAMFFANIASIFVIFALGGRITTLDVKLLLLASITLGGFAGTYLLYKYYYKHPRAYHIAFTTAILSLGLILITTPSSFIVNNMYSADDLLNIVNGLNL